jgi:GAF domain-containing protein
MPEATGADRKRQSQELNIFHDVAKALTSSLDLDSILQTIMEKMAEYFRPDTWSLLMVDEEHNELYFAIAVGDAAEALKDVRLKVGEGIAGWVAKNGEQLIVPDVYTDPRFAKRIDQVTQWETRSIICVPLNSKHRVLGVIQLVNVDMKGFADQEIFFLQALCDYAAIAIENSRAVEKIQELTITDDCTGLYNARHLYKTLETEVYRSSRFGYEFSVLFIDLDHFKQVNDTHGHLIGSKLLAEIGYLVKAQLRLICLSLRWRRVCGPAATDGKRPGALCCKTTSRRSPRQHVLQRRRPELECPRLDWAGHLSSRRQVSARRHPSSRRNDVSGEKHHPR